MDRRIETRVVFPSATDLSCLIQKDACEVWWITVDIVGKDGKLWLYDGFDSDGKLQWYIEVTGPIHCNFIPPIPCDYGIYVVTHVNYLVNSYTIAYRPKSWRKEQ